MLLCICYKDGKVQNWLCEILLFSGVGEAELHLARTDIANFLHARALSHCQLAITSFTRYNHLTTVGFFCLLPNAHIILTAIFQFVCF